MGQFQLPPGKEIAKANETQFFQDLEEVFGIKNHVVALVVSSRNKEAADKASSFVEALAKKYPWAQIVSGEASPVERTATVVAGMLGLRSIIIKDTKERRKTSQTREKTASPWDAGPVIRDERICAAATDVVLFDKSSRCKRFEELAKRQLKRVWYV